MGSGDDGAHSQNEKIEVRNYIEGVSINIFYFINCVVQMFINFCFYLTILRITNNL